MVFIGLPLVQTRSRETCSRNSASRRQTASTTISTESLPQKSYLHIEEMGQRTQRRFLPHQRNEE